MSNLKIFIKSLKKIKYKIFIAILITSLFTFFLGAHFHKQRIWPFGKGFYEDIAAKMEMAEEYEKTTLHNLKIDKIDFYFDHIAIKDENLDKLTLIGILGNGAINGIEKIKLEIYEVEINLKEKKIISNTLIFQDDNNFRATDLLISNEGNIYFSHASSNEHGFLNLKVTELIKKNNKFESKLIYKTKDFPPPFGVHQTGGKMTLFDKDNILIAVGDFQKGNLIQENDNDLGKTVLVGIKNNKKSIYTTGHRNIQGLTYSKYLQKFISTEHGPQGGDEINILKAKSNYGWPHESYGIPYGENPQGELYSNFGGANFGFHSKYTKPEFAFIPSIGIKAIEQISESMYEFPQWKNNFLICSGNGLYRIFIAIENRQTKIQFTEKINNSGCRDLAISKQGLIITNNVKIISRNKGPRG